MDSFSISNSMSKGSVYESDSICKAYQDDAASRAVEGGMPDAISNERIGKGDVLLETYRVEYDAIYGGMGSVWKVRHESWNTDLAMKRPQPRFFAEAGENRKGDFVAECEHWINLGLHPNIVACYYVREIGGVPTIFSEWMDGGSLKDAIRDGRLYEGTEAEVQARILDIAIQTARGLRYSHEQGLIHQDVKPGNILLSGDWQAKVADFGLARAQSRLSDGEKPASSGYTLAYCPREQAEGQEAAVWMDVYAWALSVLEMYMGERPWTTGPEVPARLAAYMESARRKAPEQVAALLAQCVSVQIEDMESVEFRLKKAWLALTGMAYARATPVAAADTPDSLNNRALSFLDLGMARVARQLFDAAMERDPDAALARFNRDLMRMRGDWETWKGDDAYRVLSDMGALARTLSESCMGRPTALKHALHGELLSSMYAVQGAEMELEQAARLSGDNSYERERWQRRAQQAKRAWMPLPFRPDEMLYGGFCFNTWGDTLALAWPEEVDLDGEYAVDCVSIALYDIPERREIIRRRLKGRVSFTRVFLEADRVVLWYGEDTCAAFDLKTLDPLGQISGEPYAPKESDPEWWPHMTLKDGLRQLTDITKGREEAEWTNRRSTFTTFSMGREPCAERSGLTARIPAAGMWEDDHALEVDSDCRWILVYRRPYTDQAKDTFFICDSEFYGRMPEYVIARAVSTMEQISVQQRRRAALDRAADAIARKNPECFEALKEAYALYPDNPDEEWMALNGRAGGLGVRKGILGTHKGAVMEDRALGEREDPLLGYADDDPEYTLYDACRLEISRQGDEWIGELDDEIVAVWPGHAIREDVAAMAHYDRGRNTAYLCCNGLLTVWDCACQPAILRGKGVRYGVPLPEKDPEEWNSIRDFEAFLPTETEKLWAIEPEYFMLNRVENATVAILRGRVLNIYGADRIGEDFMGIDGFSAVEAIDLRAMKRLRQVFYSRSSNLIRLEAERLAFAECNLAGMSSDGSVMAWNRYAIGSELWAFPEPGVILTHVASDFEISGVRRDGNALLTTLSYSAQGDKVQEILLEWEFGEKRQPEEPFESDVKSVEVLDGTDAGFQADPLVPREALPEELRRLEAEREARLKAIDAERGGALTRLRTARDDARAKLAKCAEAFAREDARWNTPERRALESEIEQKRNAIQHLGLFGLGKKKRMTAELALLERRIADWFVDRRLAKEGLEAAQKQAVAAEYAYHDFMGQLQDGELGRIDARLESIRASLETEEQ